MQLFTKTRTRAVAITAVITMAVSGILLPSFTNLDSASASSVPAPILHYDANDQSSFNPGQSPTDVKNIGSLGLTYDAEIKTSAGATAITRDSGTFKFDGTETAIKIPALPTSVNFSQGITIDFVADFGQVSDSWERVLDLGTGPSQPILIVSRAGTQANDLWFEFQFAGTAHDPADGSRMKAGFPGAIQSGLQRYTLVADGSSVALYLNGTLSQSYTDAVHQNVPMSVGLSSNFIGRSSFVADHDFEGMIRYVRLYDQGLTAQQVLDTEIQYKTVTFDANGGSGTMASQSGATAASLNTNTFTPPTNQRFDGWSKNSDASTLDFADGGSFDFSIENSLTLYARWVPDGEIVTFNANGGAGSIQPQLAKVSTALSANTFTNGNKPFLGWNTSQDGTGTTYSDQANYPFATSGNQVLYAQWGIAPDRTVTFNANGGTGSMANQVLSESAALSANEFERDNFAFEKWSTNADGSGTSYNDEEVFEFNQDLTLYAQWVETKAFSVTFNGNGASSGTMNAQTASEAKPLRTNTFVRSGRSFLGWATSSKGQVEYEDKDIYDFEQDIVLFAVWGTAVTITFDANGGTGTMADQQLSANQILRANTFQRSGYVFSHWATSAAGGGTRYPDGWAGAVLPGNTTLYAQWVQDSGAMVSFNANGGSLGTLLTPQDHTTAKALTNNGFRAPSHRAFRGWATQANGGGTFYENKEVASFNQDTVLYAQWGFNIQLRPGGGSPNVNRNVVITSPGVIPESPFSRNGQVFVGWTHAGCSNQGSIWFTPGEPISLTRRLVLVACWRPAGAAGEEYVAFAPNGGTLISAGSYPQTQAASGPTRLNPTPYERAGFTFRGWSLIRNQRIAFTDEEIFPFDRTQALHAVWWQNRVRFEANGGTGNAINQSTRVNSALATGNFNRSGYVLSGWNTAPDGSGKSYAESQEFPFGSPEQTLTLYAQWTAVTGTNKTVRFDSNGATAGFMTPQQANSQTALSSNKYTRNGYQFAGWNEQRDGSGTAYSDAANFTFSNDDILYAQWTPLVTYRPNGGTGATVFQEITNTSHTLTPNSFTRSGHKFIGWAVNPNHNPVYVDAQTLNLGSQTNITNRGAITLYARWAPVDAGEHIVVYQSNFSSQAVRWQVSSTAANLNQSFGQNGHTLLGWATSPNGVIQYGLRESYAFNSDLVLYAVWEQNTIKFDANGGVGTTPNQVRTWNTALAASGFSRNGFVFSTWNTELDGSGQAYSAGLTYPFGSQNRSTTLYAQWLVVPGSQVVSFNANGGTGTMRTQVTPSNASITLAPNGFQRAGHTFISWNTEADGTGTEYQEGQTIQISNANLTLYAVWEDNGSITTRTVTFDGNGATSGTMATQSVNGRTVLTSSAFVKTNSVFTGWNTAANGSGQAFADNSQILALADVTLYAQWFDLQGAQVALSFNPNGGSGTPIAPIVGAQNESKTLPQNSFARAGFKFLGWDTDKNASSATNAAGSTVTLPGSSVTYFAVWEAEFFTVTFNANGGTGTMASQTSDEATNLFANGFTKSKHQFVKWNTQADGNGTDYLDAASYPFTESRTLYAVWEQVDFTVTFNKNGGAGTMSDQVASGTQPLASNTFTRTGYRFQGWATTSNGVVAYANTANFDFSVDDELFAIWQQLSVVTFDKNASDATGTMATQTGLSSAPLRTNEFEREGYTFTGWNTNAAGSATTYSDGATYTFASSTTLYAQWALTTYTVTFNANGGSGTMASQTAAGLQSLNTMSGLSRTGWTFLGWNRNPNATTALFADEASFNFVADTVLYAIWSKTKYSLTWDSNGGSTITGTNFVLGDTIRKPTDPIRTGFTFGGWSTTETSNQGNVADLISSWPYTPPSAANVTLYAIWYAPCNQTQATFTLNGIQYVSVEVLSGSNCLITLPAGVANIDVLVVGGGGGGASFGTTAGGGGGGGGVSAKSTVLVVDGANIIASVGEGGIGGRTGSLDGGDGGQSKLTVDNFSLTSGGGKGGKSNASNQADRNQAIGGASDANGDSDLGGQPVGQGKLGGDGGYVAEQRGAHGQEGYSLNFSGTNRTFGSSGGGASWGNAPGGGTNPPAPGGSGAGSGENGSSGFTSATSGVANLGGGGGGAGGGGTGGNGGSGLVSIRFQIPTYPVTFQLGSLGAGALSSLTKTFSSTLQLPDATAANAAFQRAEYMVGGWATSDGGPLVYALGASYTTEAPLTLYPAWVPLAVVATEDSYVQSGQAATTNFGASETLALKNAANTTTGNSNRVSYLKFQYSPNLTWNNAVLEVYVAENSDGTTNNGYNQSFTTFNVDVYGATDASWDEGTLSFQSANGSSQGWGLNTGTWPWTPDLASYLGTLSIPTSALTVGQKFSISTADLDEFLNDDADGIVTLILVRSDTDGGANLSLASKENTTYPGPTLAIAGAGYTFTVAYDLNGGSGTAPQPGSFTTGSASHTVSPTTGITAPTNKFLVGWNTRADGTGDDFAPGDTYSTSRSVTFYAKYQDNPQVQFEANFAGGPNATFQSIPPSTPTSLSANVFNRLGFNFAGWNTSSDGSGTSYVDQGSITITADTTLYAQWLGASYQVLYEYNGADGGNGSAFGFFTTGENALTLPSPTRTGYTFVGWFDNAALSGSAVASSFTTTVDITLYAKWSAVDYTLTYATTDSTGGSAPIDSGNYNIGDSAVIKANTSLVRAGYSFLGWVLDPTDNSETPKNAGDQITFGSQNLTLTPSWSPLTLTITYDGNGETAGSVPSQDSFTSGGTAVTLPTVGSLVKTGHNFEGWSLTAGGAKLSTTFTTTENVTLYAIWAPKPITITYAVGTASGSAAAVTVPGIVTSTFSETITLGSPSSTSLDVDSDSNTDHTFLGWSDGTNTYQSGDTLVLGDSNLTLTAQWIRVFQVRYALGGGIFASGDSEYDTECGSAPDYICTDQQQITSNDAPTRTGFTFTGWKDQVGADIAASTSFTVDGDSYQLYAQWTAIDYTFSFDAKGGDGAPADIVRNIGQTFTLPSPGVKTGYTFAGWSTSSVVYPASSSFLVGSAGASFEALWTPDIYTITYDWQGGNVVSGQSALVSASYTVDSGDMTLPSGSTYERDGYSFSHWAATPNGTAVANYQPVSDGVLYAVWADGSYDITIDPKGGTVVNTSVSVPRTTNLVLPSATRSAFVLVGWFDAASGGTQLGDAGDSIAINKSQTIYARWVQESLFGVDEAQLESVATLNVGSSTGGTIFRIHGQSGISAKVEVPVGALPDNTVVSVRFFKDTQAQGSLIAGDNDYIISLLVSWLTGTGDSATVPDTDPNKPIEVTLTSPLIKAGQRIFQLIGTQVTDLGVAQADSSITAFITQDPALVIAATAPDAPTGVSATSADSEATITWNAPASDGGEEITSYTVVASGGAGSCTTATTSCTITGLTNGVSYTFTVTATNSVGGSIASLPSTAVTPAPVVYTVTFNSNGGSAVAAGSFGAGGSVTAPASPSRAGFNFDGWSTVQNDATTKVSFPYSPPVDAALTLYALWVTPPPSNNSGGSSGGSVGGAGTPAPVPTPAPGSSEAPPSQIGFVPTPPQSQGAAQAPAGSIAGSSEQVRFVGDQNSQRVAASATGWELSVAVSTEVSSQRPVERDLRLEFEVRGAAEVSGAGFRPNTVVEAWIFSEATYLGTIAVGQNGSFLSELVLPSNILPGEHTLQLGTLDAQGRLVVLSFPITVKGKVTVGTFKGFIAIYTLHLDGQRLSARVAGKWIVQNPISAYKSFRYSRLLRFTGAGYDILVDVYINRQFFSRTTTRTR